ncbi:DUF6427 family protein [Myroides sp. LJL119]
MLASIFSKTKPINYIILTILLLVCFVIYQFTQVYSNDFTLKTFGIKSTELLLILLMMYLSQFVVSRNRLVRDNAYVPLFFVCFVLFFPSVLNDIKLLISNYFIMLALRRIYSLHSLKQSKEKIFDASLWIFVASLFHFWSILFVILLFVAIAGFVQKDHRNFVIPILAFIAVFIGLTIYLLYQDVSYSQWFLQKARVSFDFMYFDNVFENLSLAVFVSVALLFFVAELMALPLKAYNMQSTYKKMLLTFLIGIAVYVLSDDKNNGMLIFSFFPLSILGANYVDRIPQNWRKEAVVYSVFLLAISFYIGQVIL